MNAPLERRENLAQRTSEMRDFISQMDSLDVDTTTSRLDPIVRERLASDRILPRLVMRRGRRIAQKGLFFPITEDREKALLNGGAGLIEALNHTVGVHILWQEVVRLVRRTDVDALNEALGIETRDVALRARDKSFGATPLRDDAKENDLVERAKREGAMSWACWLAGGDPMLARRLRVLTPNSVSSFVQGGLPEDSEQRELRRHVVEFELDRLVALLNAEASEEKVR